MIRKLREAGAHRWMPDYLKGRLQAQRRPRDRPCDVLFLFADHWEPSVGAASEDDADRRTGDWARLYPRAAAPFRDSDGRAPAHTFFYPWDQYRRSEIEALAEMSGAGLGEVELHLHHRDDTSASLAARLQDAVGLYRASGCMGTGRDGRPAFGFVHGDWSLDNARQEGGRNFCGVDDEITLLARAGCFADYTFPAFGCSAQPRWVNRILRVTDDPERPRSYETGTELRAGDRTEGDLLLFAGPLTLHWSGGRPRLDDGQVTGVNVPREDRVQAWVDAGIHVRGRPEWVFVKVHTHGCTERNRLPLLTRELPNLWRMLESRFNDGERFRLHYVTAREAYNIARAAEDGCSGNAGDFRDYEILPPPCRSPRPDTRARELESVA